jgi:hypothetical protein
VETLLKQNIDLTQAVRTLVERIDAMTSEPDARMTPAELGSWADRPSRRHASRGPQDEVGTAYLSINSIVCSRAAGETLNMPV